MTRSSHRLTGRVRIARAREEAFQLFTPRGEQDWVEGWEPHFPTSPSDDSAPGTVFQVAAHGHTTTWVVTDRTPGRSIRYVRVIPGVDAGTVDVTLEPTPAGTTATVTYELTALSRAGDDRLRDFAAGYRDFLLSWENAIGTAAGETSPRNATPASPN